MIRPDGSLASSGRSAGASTIDTDYVLELHRLSFWDALIVRAALVAGCGRLYSEDLHHGWKIEGLEIVNPFA